MSLNDYKLSCELRGHSLDVRSVTEGSDFILSGSRDMKVKMWAKEGNSYKERATLQNHSNYVAVVFYLEDEGWICTGSNDSTICIYTSGSLVPVHTLKEHSATVSCLCKGLEPRSIVSGSWDKTGRIWRISDANTVSSVALQGHDAAVWAVESVSCGQRYVTGSADKNIFVWNASGVKIFVLKGHTDCVRGLIGLGNGGLLSCGNDAVIKVWNDEGECVNELFGHSNYIYSIALNRNVGEDVLVSGGEDSSLRMWSASEGALGSEMHIPAQSVWSVACLRNGDIVTGSSDGIVRIFTRDPARMAPADVLAAYQTSVDVWQKEHSAELGGIKVNDLPGPESLYMEGTEGQTRIVRQPNGKIECFQWTRGSWQLVGDVTGASGGTNASSGKTLYQGKEYDYVFSVDVEDGAPPIKLPYNRGQDPWYVAQEFIHKHNLPQVYLDQVANFVVKNSGNAPVAPSDNTFSDPFTGDSRYIPGSGGGNNVGGGNLLDPFTGASSYRTQQSEKSNSGEHFPTSAYSTMATADLEKILNKLKSFNSENAPDETKVNDSVLSDAIAVARSDGESPVAQIESLKCLLSWPRGILFPVLDLVRLAVRNEATCRTLMTTEMTKTLVECISDSAANQLMALRSLANMLAHQAGRDVVHSRLGEILGRISEIRKGSVNAQVAVATFLLNATVTQMSLANADECKILGECSLETMQWIEDREAVYRCLQALGNLTCTPVGQEILALVMSVDAVVDKIKALSRESGAEKLIGCSRDFCVTLGV
ncbi:phospholipase A-2-activating protein [Phlebotomus argentipes]|uniref:phospholipase A-2-activating protein n=1 Tax=Phlebotomus argentipes TaxID=94469 RepID=UPI0028937DDE|nr:phospholipase A-2-activating protein [Phlebotomus argentipes]XP_059618045.1 phospholipase A-2-activating protein [Phlebotomus argentipes]